MTELEKLAMEQSGLSLDEVWVPLSEVNGNLTSDAKDVEVLCFYEALSDYLWVNEDAFKGVRQKLVASGIQIPFLDKLKANGWDHGAHRLWAVTRSGEVAVACFGEWKCAQTEYASDGFPRNAKGNIPFKFNAGSFPEGKNYDGSMWEEMGVDIQIDPDEFEDEVVESHAEDVITSERRDAIISAVPHFMYELVADAIEDPLEDFDYDAFCKEHAIPDEVLPTEEFVDKLSEWELVPDGETDWLFNVKKQFRNQLHTRETFERIVEVLADDGTYGDLDAYDALSEVPEKAEWADEISTKLRAIIEAKETV